MLDPICTGLVSSLLLFVFECVGLPHRIIGGDAEGDGLAREGNIFPVVISRVGDEEADDEMADADDAAAAEWG